MSIPKNARAVPIRIAHTELLPVRDGSLARYCPKCKEGILTMQRDNVTMRLLFADRCLLCGQIVIYTDIQTLRSREP